MDDDLQWIIALIIVVALFLGVVTGWELFKLFHEFICFDQMGCVKAPWT